MRRRMEFQETMLAWDMSEIYENESFENQIYETDTMYKERVALN
jgi:hypothetical protein